MDTRRYRVRDGFETVNGLRVADDRMIDLSEPEARYEFDMGKLEAVEAAGDSQARKARPRASDAAGAIDAGT